MRISTLLFAAFAALSTPLTAAAETVLLVPGYLGSAHSWRGMAITAGLHNAGWIDAGHLTLGPADVVGPVTKPDAEKRFYTLDIPTEAPAVIQADLIARYVRLAKRRHDKDAVVLVGHSAGGVVARLAMVRHKGLAVDTLITIASPHLGTATADLARDISNSPLAWVAPFFGANTINRSRMLYHELGREGPHNMLGWLNRTPHPEARYISVVRTVGHPAAGDSVVVGWRQDMNMVPALRGRATTHYSLGEHYLRPDDGALIAKILTDPEKKTVAQAAK